MMENQSINVETYPEEENGEKKLNQKEVEKRFEHLDLELLSDVNLRVSVEAGKVEKLFYDILKLKEGDVIKLDKNIEDYIDIYVNGHHFAIGEMVVVNEKYAIRIVDLA